MWKKKTKTNPRRQSAARVFIEFEENSLELKTEKKQKKKKTPD